MLHAPQDALEQCSPNFTLPTTLAELFSLKHAINKEIKMLEVTTNSAGPPNKHQKVATLALRQETSQ
jgi:hypothetical protein